MVSFFHTNNLCANKKRGLRYSPAPIERCVEVVFMETSLLRVVAALPSRMTTSQLIECITGKKICVSGESENPNATAFEDRKIQEIGDLLVKEGFNRYGYEKMINGRTGELMEGLVFIGPNYYQRLKHMVADKVHCRSYGSTQNLNRQPTEGRAKSGGFRVGKSILPIKAIMQIIC